MNQQPKRKQIAKGYIGEGRRCTILGEVINSGDRDWLPVQFDDEEDPTLFKPEGLEEIKEEPKPTLSEMYNESMDASYNLAIGHAVKIVETYFKETLRRLHPYMATELIQKLNNLKKP